MKNKLSRNTVSRINLFHHPLKCLMMLQVAVVVSGAKDVQPLEFHIIFPPKSLKPISGSAYFFPRYFMIGQKIFKVYVNFGAHVGK